MYFTNDFVEATPERYSKRILYDDPNFLYEGTWSNYTYATNIFKRSTTGTVKFNFTGKILRILTSVLTETSKSFNISLDGKVYKAYCYYASNNDKVQQCLELLELDDGEHSVVITAPGDDGLAVDFRGIEIQESAMIKAYSEPANYPTNRNLKNGGFLGLTGDENRRVLSSAESGMTRYLYSDSKFTVSGGTVIDTNTVKVYGNGKIKVNFTGTKLRVIGKLELTSPANPLYMVVDGEMYTINTTSLYIVNSNIVFLELDELENKEHSLEIFQGRTATTYIYFTGIDIESTAELKQATDLTGKEFVDLSTIDRGDTWDVVPIASVSETTSRFGAYIYNFNSNIADEGIYGNNLVATGTTFTTDSEGVSNNAIKFTEGSYLSSSAVMSNIGNSFIIDLKVKFDEILNNTTIVSFSNNLNGDAPFALCLNPTNFYCYAPANGVFCGGFGPPTAGQYYRITLKCNPAGTKLYVDGTLKVSSTKTFASAGQYKMNIGVGNTYNPELHGTIDFVNVYHFDTDDTGIFELVSTGTTSRLGAYIYNFNGNIADEGIYGNNLVSQGTTFTTDSEGVSNNAIKFTEGTYLSSSTVMSNIGNSFIIDLKVKFDEILNNTTIVSFSNDLTNETPFKLLATPTNFVCYTPANGGFCGGFGPPTAGQYYRITLKCNPAGTKLYVDGTLKVSSTKTFTSAGQYKMNIGVGYIGHPELHGTIDFVNVYPFDTDDAGIFELVSTGKIGDIAAGTTSFNFTGDRLSLVSNLFSTASNITVNIDGKQYNSSKNQGGVAKDSAVFFEVLGLKSGTHYCSITSTEAMSFKACVAKGCTLNSSNPFKNYGTTLASLDAAETGWTRIKDRDATISYVGTTSQVSTTTYFSGTGTGTGVPLNGKVCFNFTGNYFRLMSKLLKTESVFKFNVNVDGIDLGTFENGAKFNTASVKAAMIYQSPKLSEASTSHYVEIKITEISTGTYAYLDCIDYIFYNGDINLTDSMSQGVQLEGRGLSKHNIIEEKKFVLTKKNIADHIYKDGTAEVGKYIYTAAGMVKLKFKDSSSVKLYFATSSSVRNTIILDGRYEDVSSATATVGSATCVFEKYNLDSSIEHTLYIFTDSAYIQLAFVLLDSTGTLVNIKPKVGECGLFLEDEKVVKIDNFKIRSFYDELEREERTLDNTKSGYYSQGGYYSTGIDTTAKTNTIALIKSSKINIYTPSLSSAINLRVFIDGRPVSCIEKAADSNNTTSPVKVFEISGLDSLVYHKLEIKYKSDYLNIDYIAIDLDGDVKEYEPTLAIGKPIYNPVDGYRTLAGAYDEAESTNTSAANIASSMGMKRVSPVKMVGALTLPSGYFSIALTGNTLKQAAGKFTRFNILSKRLKLWIYGNAAVTDLRIYVDGVQKKGINCATETPSGGNLVLSISLESDESYISIEPVVGSYTDIYSIEIDAQGKILPYDETKSYSKTVPALEKTLLHYNHYTGTPSLSYKGNLNRNNSRVEFKFTGTSFMIIGGAYLTSPVGTSLNIYIDEVLVDTINPRTIAATYEDILLYRKDGLEDKEHFIRITNTDDTSANATKISAVLVNGSSTKYFKPLLGDKIVENILPNDWENPFYFKDDAKKTDDIIRLEKNSSFTQLVVGSAGSGIIGTVNYVGETIKFKFTGKILGVLSYMYSGYASDNKITVDGVDYAFDNKTYTNIADPDGNKVSFYKDDLSDAEHEVVIQNVTSVTANACNLMGIIIGKGKTFVSYGEKTEGDISIVAETGWKSWDAFLNNMLFYKGGQLANPNANSPKIVLNSYFNASDIYFECKFRFTGSKLRVVGVKRITSNSSVIMGVTPTYVASENVGVEIDGVEIGTFSQVSPNSRQASNVINFIKTDLSAGEHTCRIYSKVPLRTFMITRVDIGENESISKFYNNRNTLPAVSAGMQRIEATSTNKLFFSTSAASDYSDASASGGSCSYNTAKTSFKVKTTKLKIISMVANGTDKAAVYIDGVFKGRFSNNIEYGNTYIYKYLAFEIDGMEDIEHVVDVVPEISGDSNKYIYLDAIDIDSAGTVNNGVWCQINTPEAGWKRVLAQAGTDVRLNAKNYRTALKFTGKKVRVLSYNNTSTPIRVLIDGIEKTVIPMAISAASTISFEDINLSEGEHLIEVFKGGTIDSSFTITGFDVSDTSTTSKPEWKVGDYVNDSIYPELANNNITVDESKYLGNTVMTTDGYWWCVLEKYKIKNAKKIIITESENSMNGFLTDYLDLEKTKRIPMSSSGRVIMANSHSKNGANRTVLDVITVENPKDFDIVVMGYRYGIYLNKSIFTDGIIAANTEITPTECFYGSKTTAYSGFKRIEGDSPYWKIKNIRSVDNGYSSGNKVNPMSGSIKFTGKKLSVVGYSATAIDYSMTSLKLDGVELIGSSKVSDNYSYGIAANGITGHASVRTVNFFDSELSDTEHTLEVVGTIDFIEVDEGSIVTKPPYVVGDVCVAAPSGMKRIEETDANLTWNGTWTDIYYGGYSGSYGKYTIGSKNSVSFILKSKKLYFICQTFSNRVSAGIVKINGTPYNFSQKNYNGTSDLGAGTFQVICFIKNDLPDGENKVEIICGSDALYLSFDAMDIDSDGYILPYSPPPEYKDAVPTPRTGYKRIENNDNDMFFQKYTDGLTWGDTAYGSFSGTTAKTTNISKSKVSFKFTGTKLAIISYFYSVGYPDAIEIWIDGVLKATNSCLFAELAKACVFSDYSLEDKEHTCVIIDKNNSTYSFSLDAIDIDKNATITKWRPDYVVGDAAPYVESNLGWKRFDSDNTMIYCESASNIADAESYQGYYKKCTTTNKKIAFNFTGGKIRIISKTTTTSSTMRVKINGVEYSAAITETSSRPQVIVFEKVSGIIPAEGFDDNVCEIYSTTGECNVDAIELEGELNQYNPYPILILFKKDDLYYQMESNGALSMLGTEVSDSDFINYGISAGNLMSKLNFASGYKPMVFVSSVDGKKVNSLEIKYIPMDCLVSAKEDYMIPKDVLKIKKIKFPNSIITGSAECRISFSLDSGITWKKYNTISKEIEACDDFQLGNFPSEFEIMGEDVLQNIFDNKKIRFRYFFTKENWIDTASINQLQFIMDYKAYQTLIKTGYELYQKNGNIEVKINVIGSYTVKWFN